MNDVKFADMSVGDAVIFQKPPMRGAPVSGRVTELTRMQVTYRDDWGTTTTLRRASLVCDSRVRIEGGKWSWTFV
jgi:hypothetical protein